MFSRLSAWLIIAALAAMAPLRAEEQNAWPFAVRQLQPDGTMASAQYVGPLFFTKSNPAGEIHGFRPVYLHAYTVEEHKKSSSFIYPLFTWESEPGYHSFSFFQLINRKRYDDARQPAERHFDIWPFYFSKETGDPATTYHALFPIAGTIKGRFGYDRLTWYVFPLYLQSEKPEIEVTNAPWPFLRFIGGDSHGFEFWPLFGSRTHPGDYHKQFWIWPLGYKQELHLDQPEPTIRLGILPFYARDSAPGLISETYVWPFFGYTHRTDKEIYDEQRYFWPFFVQGRGNVRTINRWAPFYTHSVVKGYDKTWVLWPVVRHAVWEDDGVSQEKNQVLYFLYWSLTQHSLTNPAAAPAHKTHLWPLASWWDNGAGRKQVQVLSPFEVFFPTNEPIRQLYTPLFAIYRYDRQGDDAVRHSFLWNAVTYRRNGPDKEFHFGPLYSVKAGAASKRVAILCGVFGWQRRPGESRSKFFLFDFHPKKDTKATEATPP